MGQSGAGRWVAVIVILGGLCGQSAKAGQASGSPGPRLGGGSPATGQSNPDPAMVRMEEQVAKSRNDERQKRLVADTAKLYELATQLKEDVSKSDKNTLSVDVVKKAEEIEKLAKSVKEKMRG